MSPKRDTDAFTDDRAGRQLMDQRQGSQTPHASARHFLGAELRRWRRLRQLSVAELARQIFVSRELLQKVETVQRRASADLIHACDAALDTGGALGSLFDFITHTEREPAAAVQPQQAELPHIILIRITAEVVAAETPDVRPPSSAEGARLAKVYPLDERRRRVGVIIDPPQGTGGAVRLVAAAHTQIADPGGAPDA